MKVLKILGIIIGIILLIIVILGIIAPSEIRVERSIEIEAPSEVIHDEVVHFENFEHWSPWAHLDPDMQTQIEGTDGTVGAIYRWEGSEHAGKGQQEITNINDDRIDIRVTFYEPWESVAESYFKLDENESGTLVSWGFTSGFSFPMNIFGLFFNMEDAIGKDYQKGLENLKSHIEGKQVN